MTVYRMEKVSEKNIYRNLRWAMVAINLFFGALLLGSTFYFEVLDNWLLLILSPIYLLILFISTQRYFRKFEETWSYLEIELGEEYIESRQKHKPEFRIQRSEILHLTNKKGLTVRTSNLFNSIHIPEDLVGFDEIKSVLDEWSPVKTPPLRRNILLASPLLVAIVGILVGAILAIITRSIWAVVLLILMIMIQAAYLGWINYQRVDLTLRAKRFKLLYYSLFFLALLYFLVKLLRDMST